MEKYTLNVSNMGLKKKKKKEKPSSDAIKNRKHQLQNWYIILITSIYKCATPGSEMWIGSTIAQSHSGRPSTSAEISVSVTDKTTGFLSVVRGHSCQKSRTIAVKLNTGIWQWRSTWLCSPQLYFPCAKWPEFFRNPHLDQLRSPNR